VFAFDSPFNLYLKFTNVFLHVLFFFHSLLPKRDYVTFGYKL